MQLRWLEIQIGIALAALMVLSVISCGNSGQKKAIVIKSVPNPSIVIESDFVRTYVGTDGKLIKDTRKGPWTLWQFEANNVSTGTITIFALHYELNANGQKVSGDITGADTFLISESKDYLFSLNPGEGTFNQVIIANLPTREQVGFLNYLFFGKAMGWYGTPAFPEKSYKTTFTFKAAE